MSNRRGATLQTAVFFSSAPQTFQPVQPLDVSVVLFSKIPGCLAKSRRRSGAGPRCEEAPGSCEWPVRLAPVWTAGSFPKYSSHVGRGISWIAVLAVGAYTMYGMRSRDTAMIPLSSTCVWVCGQATWAKTPSGSGGSARPLVTLNLRNAALLWNILLPWVRDSVNKGTVPLISSTFSVISLAFRAPT